MSTEEENLKLWDQFGKTKGEFTKEVTEGNFTYTSINPYYQIQQATKKWGAYGDRWGVRNKVFTNFNVGEKKTIIPDTGTEITAQCLMCNYTAVLYYLEDSVECELEIESAINISWVSNSGNVVTNKYYSKSVATDALTKGLSFLGFGNDIFLQEYTPDVIEDIKSQKGKISEDIDLRKEFENFIKKQCKSGKITKVIEKAWLGNKKLSDKVMREFINEKKEL